MRKSLRFGLHRRDLHQPRKTLGPHRRRYQRHAFLQRFDHLELHAGAEPERDHGDPRRPIERLQFRITDIASDSDLPAGETEHPRGRLRTHDIEMRPRHPRLDFGKDRLGEPNGRVLVRRMGESFQRKEAGGQQLLAGSDQTG